MTLKSFIQCDGPGCLDRVATTVYCNGRKGLQYAAKGWSYDSSELRGYADWCSEECHRRWWNVRHPERPML